MQLHCLTVGPFAENTYLLTQAGQALIIDPGFMEPAEYERIDKQLRDENLSLQAVVLTHAHVDHVLGLQKVLNNYDVPVYLSDKDRHLWDNYPSQASMFGLKVNEVSVAPKPLPITKGWEIGNFVFDVLYTPGHAPDHVSLYSPNDDIVIAGDALFKEGIGRTDLYKGDFNVLEQSIREQLYTLPEDTVIYPGHGPETTIGHEKQANPFVKAVK
ncbi:MBL fold metallo-hydrolase [Fodinibius halophilus]|uniref:MBL fold metallo-hydrolase n=1 Tax=Fodinibius halophilus TaxID=1736908 RepID=A0A6M1T708_9BACT|nr:MBL fold metallo-hydrolase [Fodinibius halophilus]NGP89967.1 MBL fold metallo-hydrolase [Fodinibius halophilus]